MHVYVCVLFLSDCEWTYLSTNPKYECTQAWSRRGWWDDEIYFASFTTGRRGENIVCANLLLNNSPSCMHGFFSLVRRKRTHPR